MHLSPLDRDVAMQGLISLCGTMVQDTVLWQLPYCDPVRSVTIDPFGRLERKRIPQWKTYCPSAKECRFHYATINQKLNLLTDSLERMDLSACSLKAWRYLSCCSLYSVFMKKGSNRRWWGSERSSFPSRGDLGACTPRKFWIFKPSAMQFPDIWRHILFLTSAEQKQCIP